MYPVKSSSRHIAVVLGLALLFGAPAFAQDESAPPPASASQSSGSELPPDSVRPVPRSPYASPTTTAPGAAEAKAPKSHKFFPYTVRAGDSLGSIAQFFGMTTADLAHINKLQEDDELDEGESLKIPNPFEASQRSLEAQAQQLSDQNRADEQKIESAQAQVATLTTSNSDLTSENATLKESVKVLPWWRGTALAVAAAALLMLGVTTLTLFEWWMLRRRFLALSDLSISLSRLDVKYKETIAKAELRMQQLYGRRRAAGPPEHLLVGMKTSDEIKIERLSHELRETLERHLSQLGVRGRRTIGARWRETIGEEEPAPAPRPYRR